MAVFRAGLGLIDAALDLIPDARIGYAGVQRNEETAEPMEYYTKFPPMADARVLILEPMLATGGSLAWACDQVKAKGASDITAVCVVSAPAGHRSDGRAPSRRTGGHRRARSQPERCVLHPAWSRRYGRSPLRHRLMSLGEDSKTAVRSMFCRETRAGARSIPTAKWRRWPAIRAEHVGLDASCRSQAKTCRGGGWSATVESSSHPMLTSRPLGYEQRA